ncbi:MAG: DUF2461 domain-containing protein [Chitinophagales bacterium]|nr:DUF2461 domain-containing protein [Chitinophagales bacterium]
MEKSTLQFLKDLKANNNKEWFDINRKVYESAKKNFLDFTTEVIKKIEKFDKEIQGIDPKKTLFRINRDIRFSKDKSPYKTNMGASISKGGKLDMSAGYYFHLEPGGAFCAGGSYQPMPPQLTSIRQEIDYNFKEFKKIITSAAYKKYFNDLDVVEKLKTIPKGYSAENPAIEYLKHKSFIVSKTFTDKEVLSATFTDDITYSFKAVRPLISFLNNAMNGL